MDEILTRLRRLAASSADRPVKAREVAELICAARSYHWVGLYDVTPARIAAIAWTGSEAPAFPSFPADQGLNGAAVASGAPVVVQDVSSDARYLATFASTGSEAIFPVRGENGAIVGTIDVESERRGAFTPEDEAFLGNCAEALAALWTKA